MGFAEANLLSGYKPDPPVNLSPAPGETEPEVKLGVAGVGHCELDSPSNLAFEPIKGMLWNLLTGLSVNQQVVHHFLPAPEYKAPIPPYRVAWG